jgi:hypothetical protein
VCGVAQLRETNNITDHLYSKYPFQNKRDWDQLIIDVRQYKEFYEHKTVKVRMLMLDSTMPLHFESVNMEVNSK